MLLNDFVSRGGGGGGGVTPLYGLYGDVPLGRVHNFAQVCPKQCAWFVQVCSSNEIEGVVLSTVCILGIFCPKQGQSFKPSAAHPYPNIGWVPRPPPPEFVPWSRQETRVALILLPCFSDILDFPGNNWAVKVRCDHVCILVERKIMMKVRGNWEERRAERGSQ